MDTLNSPPSYRGGMLEEETMMGEPAVVWAFVLELTRVEEEAEFENKY